MDRDIVLWRTGAYDPASEYYKGDIVAMDLRTGSTRRLTTKARYVGVLAPMSLPRAILFGERGSTSASYKYVVNLEALGVVDDQGHLLAGPGLDEITELGDP